MFSIQKDFISHYLTLECVCKVRKSTLDDVAAKLRGFVKRNNYEKTKLCDLCCLYTCQCVVCGLQG